MAPREDHSGEVPRAQIGDPALNDALVIKHDLRVPKHGEFKGYVKEEDLSDLGKRDRKMLLAMSVLEQWTDWNTDELIAMHGAMRQIDANSARRFLEMMRQIELAKKELAEFTKEQDVKRKRKERLRWAGQTAVAALIVAAAKALFDWLTK